MATATINIGSQNNQPPSQSGWVVIETPYNTPVTLTVANFTTETNPVYADPEGDALRAVLFSTVPSVGQVTNNGVVVNPGDEVLASELNSGVVVYTPSNDVSGYRSGGLFYVSDEGSGQYNITSNRYNFSVGSNINRPPSVVGDGEANVTLGETYVFTRASLTTQLNPPYSDPEGDAANQLLVESVPLFGELQLNGTVVVDGQIINFTDIDSGLFTYVSQEFPTDAIEGFIFKISDTGSGEFTG